MTEFKVGDIFRLRDHQAEYRVVAIDSHQVHCDFRRAGESWDGKNRRRSLNTRMHISILADAVLTGEEAFDDVDRSRHNPHLPLRLCKTRNWRWGQKTSLDLPEFIRQLRHKKIDFDPLETIDESVVELALLAKRKSGSHLGSPVKIKPVNGIFSLGELFWAANKIQPDLLEEEGCALHRSGFVSTAPLYYVWGARDMAGCYPEL